MPGKNWLPNWEPLSFAPPSASRRRSREDHASYLDHWLTILKEDKRAIFSAAAHAQRAADYLNDLQPKRRERGGLMAATSLMQMTCGGSKLLELPVSPGSARTRRGLRTPRPRFFFFSTP